MGGGVRQGMKGRSDRLTSGCCTRHFLLHSGGWPWVSSEPSFYPPFGSGVFPWPHVAEQLLWSLLGGFLSLLFGIHMWLWASSSTTPSTWLGEQGLTSISSQEAIFSLLFNFFFLSTVFFFFKQHIPIYSWECQDILFSHRFLSSYFLAKATRRVVNDLFHKVICLHRAAGNFWHLELKVWGTER